jgi:hypothetical protein
MNTRPRNLLILLTILLIGIALGTVAGMRIAASPSAAQPTTAAARLEFAVVGKPIHPAVIQMLMCPMAASSPFIRAVDVAAFDDSDAYELRIEWGRTTASRLDDNHARTGEYIAYTHVGRLRGGEHVLDVSECTGGSGIFRSLLFVRLDDVAQSSVLGDRPGVLMMSSVDQISLGDRNDARVSVEGDGVLIQGRLEGELAALGAGKDWVVLKVR